MYLLSEVNAIIRRHKHAIIQSITANETRTVTIECPFAIIELTQQ